MLVRSSVPINDEKGEVMSTLHGCKKQDEDGAQRVWQELIFSSQETLSLSFRFKQVAIYFQPEDSSD